MKQLLQNLRDGHTQVAEVPVPSVRPKSALVKTAASLVSAGTERALVDFAEKNLVEKARSRPDLVRQVIDKARREGIRPTIEAAFNRLDQPMVLGYSSAGTIVEVGEGLTGFQPGDRVACAGGGFAVHAEYEVVPQNLMVKLPDEVSFEKAAFTTLGAIALHGFRLASPEVGERVAVIGLGLLGLLAVQIAQAAGCSVFGVDIDPQRVELAESLGFQVVVRSNAESAGAAFSQGRGFDTVLICADTESDDPVELAGALARDRGIVVAVGAVGMTLPRKVYYEKELQFLISRSYGPGRYDAGYEEEGHDYPYGYVRWTEGRNMQAVADLMAAGHLNVERLISHRFPIDRATEAYELITGKKKEPFLGVLLTYPQDTEIPEKRRIELPVPAVQPVEGEPGLGVLGAGNYAGAVFLPVVERVGGVNRLGIATGTGLSARNAAEKFGFRYASSDEGEIFADEQVRIVAVLTRHQHHARQVVKGLGAGKHVFCEKPLAITPEGLEEVITAMRKPGAPLLTVGFNRRFAPFALRMKDFLRNLNEPLFAHYRVNAGFLPESHWLHDLRQGGGRLIGEGCHFVDFLTFLVGQPPVSVRAHALPNQGRYRDDNFTLTLTFPDGSIGTIDYLANGDKSFPKERVEVFCAGSVAVLDDFRSLELVRNGKRERVQARMGQDKGHRALWTAFLQAVKSGGEAPIPYEHLIGVTRATFAAVRSLQQNCDVSVE